MLKCWIRGKWPRYNLLFWLRYYSITN